MLDHQGAGVYLAALCGPGLGGIVHRVARFGQGQYQLPLQGALSQALLQVVLQVILVLDVRG
ncbi:hypothetical protein D3C80_2057410 [compost metagenome]